MNKLNLQGKLENAGWNVHTYDDSISVELETWTNGGVNIIINITSIENIERELKEFVNSFDIDEEIDCYREDESYKANFTIKDSLEDFTTFIEGLKALL